LERVKRVRFFMGRSYRSDGAAFPETCVLLPCSANAGPVPEKVSASEIAARFTVSLQADGEGEGRRRRTFADGHAVGAGVDVTRDPRYSPVGDKFTRRQHRDDRVYFRPGRDKVK
jgi:hypothetical protein